RDAASGKVVLIAKSYDDHSARSGHFLSGVVLSPDGDRHLTVGWDGAARVWDLKDGTLRATFRQAGAVTASAFALDGLRVVTVSDDGHLRVWDASRGNQTTSLDIGVRDASAVRFLSDGNRVIVAANSSLHVWDIGAGKLVRSYRSGIGASLQFESNPDGT